jgi:glycosyltransferase involved in cell wall biosynthesis
MDMISNKNVSKKSGKYLVSAIVSVFNCERFLEGCLEDLEAQTTSQKTEIVIVSTGSEENEKAIVEAYQKKFDNIVFLETPRRETLYKAWNIGIERSSGKYITNANSDDRHRSDAFEVMSKFLDNNEEIDLVYADSIITETENETFERCTPVGFMDHFDVMDRVTFSIGPHPMWRRRIHQMFGLFDERLEAAGDYEFWMRIAGKCKFGHIKERLGLYLRNPVSAERRNYERTALEVIDVKRRYLNSPEIDFRSKIKLRAGISKKYSDLTNYYCQKGRHHFMRDAALKGLRYNCFNYHNYFLLLLSFLPHGFLKKTKVEPIDFLL